MYDIYKVKERSSPTYFIFLSILQASILLHFWVCPVVKIVKTNRSSDTNKFGVFPYYAGAVHFLTIIIITLSQFSTIYSIHRRCWINIVFTRTKLYTILSKTRLKETCCTLKPGKRNKNKTTSKVMFLRNSILLSAIVGWHYTKTRV